MKTMIFAAFAALALAGCQTVIKADKHAETAVPYVTTTADGAVTNGFQVLSGGWSVSARSPLWADEAIKGLDVGTSADGSVHLTVKEYDRDLSTNAVTMAHNLVTDFGAVAEKCIAAYASCGVSLAAGKAESAVKKAIASYITKGGSSGKAQVNYDQKTGMLTITDGTTTEVCTDGTCEPTY